MIIPATVSGRAVTNRGAHFAPHGFPAWVSRADYWVGLLQSMHMSWCVLLSESDAAVKSGAAEALLDGGRDSDYPVRGEGAQHGFTEMKATEQLVALYSRYGAPCIIQVGMSRLTRREAANSKWPPKDRDVAWNILADRWNEAARLIVERGAIAGFPDGPCYDRNPFAELGDPNGYWQMAARCTWAITTARAGRWTIPKTM